MSGLSSFNSSLDKAADRFLSAMMTYALDENWRTPDDFLRHFKPLDLMVGLADADSLRAELLIKAAGVHEKIAHKKSTESATEDLQIALDESITTPADVLKLFPADDRVRYLDKRRLWTFVIEDGFWNKGSTDRDRCVARMTFTLQTALDQSLLTLQDIADGVTFETIADRLPVEQLRKVVVHALTTSRRSTPLTEDSLLEVLSLEQLVGFLPLDLIWDAVVVSKVAGPAGFSEAKPESKPADAGKEAAEPKKAEAKKGDAKKSESKPTQAKPADAKPASFVPPPPPAPPPSTPPGRPSSIPPLAEADDADDETRMVSSLTGLGIPSAAEGETRTPQEEEARRKVADKLRGIDRLPPGYEKLSTPILLSIESMYAELLTCTDDESRESCIRESFPNEGHLRTALLALIELLDPSIDVHDPLIKDAEVESLIKVVLFEERHRYEQQNRSRPSPAPSGAPQRRASVPPPLPRPAPGAPDDKRAR